MMKKLLIILFSIAFIISCNKNNDGMNVIPSKYVGVYSYGDGKRIIIKDDGKTVVNQNGQSGTIEKISETEYKIKFGNTEITITFGNNNGATIKNENGKSYDSYKEEYIETDPNKGIEQFAGKEYYLSSPISTSILFYISNVKINKDNTELLVVTYDEPLDNGGSKTEKTVTVQNSNISNNGKLNYSINNVEGKNLTIQFESYGNRFTLKISGDNDEYIFSIPTDIGGGVPPTELPIEPEPPVEKPSVSEI